MKPLLRGLAVAVALGLIGFETFVGAIAILRSPGLAWRMLIHGESDIHDDRIFPSRPISRSPTPLPLPAGPALTVEVVRYPYAGATRSETLDDLFARTGTMALIVVMDDRIVLEKYAPGYRRDSIVTSFSSAKSVNSALIGAAIADGFVGSVEDAVVDYVPEIAGRGLDNLTIRDLLMMNTGIRYALDEERPFYEIPFGDDAVTYYAPDLRAVALGVTAGTTPVGAAFHYNNYHPLLEGLILERATRRSVATYLQERIWQPMGAAYDASWSLDSEDGFEKMESGINARPVDFARFGLLFLHDGMVGGRQVLPESWVAESTAPLRPDPRPWEVWQHWPDLGGYYKYHWWGLKLPDGGYDYMARGKFQQIVYVAPRRNAVVVRFGEDPDPGVSWPLVIRAIVDGL